MKKSFLLSLAAALALAPAAGAQVFDHLSIGVGPGTDGLGFELAAPLGRHVQLRAGYGAAAGIARIGVGDISVPEHPGDPGSSDADVPLSVRFAASDARLLFNIYPSATGGFHFVVGAYMGSPAFARASLTGMPSDYDRIGIDADGYLVKAEDGKLEIGLGGSGIGASSFAVKPYAGIGFGRAVRADRRVSVTCDLGVQYQGTPAFWAEGESITGRRKNVRISGNEFFSGIEEDFDALARYTAFWPTLNIRVYVRLF